MLSYLGEIFYKPFFAICVVISGICSIAAYVNLGSKLTDFERILVVVFSILFPLLINMMVVGYSIYRRTQDPVQLRQVIEGTHYYKGELLIVLDNAYWVKQDQILTLFSMQESIPAPLCLIQVQTFTTDNYPQCTIFATLTETDLREYLMDKTRWSGFKAKIELLGEYLKWKNQ